MGTVYAHGRTPDHPSLPGDQPPPWPDVIVRSRFEPHEPLVMWSDVALACSPVTAALTGWAYVATHSLWVLAACLAVVLATFLATLPQHRRRASRRRRADRIAQLEWELGIDESGAP